MKNLDTLTSKKVFNQLVEAKKFKGQRKFTEALELYLTIFNTYSSANVANAISSCYFELSELDLAKKWSNKSISIEPSEENLSDLAFYNWFACDYESSATLFKEVLEQNPNNAFALHQIISIYTTPEGEQWVEEDFAKECLETLRRNSVEDLSFINYLLGKIEFKHNEFHKAKELFEKAVTYGRALDESSTKDITEMMEIILEGTA